MGIRKARRAGMQRYCTVILLFMVIALMVVPHVAFSRTEARYEGRIGDTVFGNDLYASSNIQRLFHQQSLETGDLEHYNMTFPLLADGVQAGPLASATGAAVDGLVDVGGGGSANVLPFGLVDLAFPSLHEDVSQSISYSQTGFFAANYNYRPEEVWGNVPLTTAYPETLSRAISPASIALSPMYPEQYDTIAARNKLKALSQAQPAAGAANQTAANQTAKAPSATGLPATNRTGLTQDLQAAAPSANNTSAGRIVAPAFKDIVPLGSLKAKNASTKPEDMPVIYPSYFDLAGKDGPASPNPGYGSKSTNGAGGTGASLTGLVASGGASAGGQAANKTANATGQASAATAPAASKPSVLTYADFNFDATTQQINDMSIVERLWRNAHRGGTMGKAYVGDTSAPGWIDPYERPNDVSMIAEHWYVLQSALNMVVPGTQIMPRFWSLGIV